MCTHTYSALNWKMAYKTSHWYTQREPSSNFIEKWMQSDSQSWRWKAKSATDWLIEQEEFWWQCLWQLPSQQWMGCISACDSTSAFEQLFNFAKLSYFKKKIYRIISSRLLLKSANLQIHTENYRLLTHKAHDNSNCKLNTFSRFNEI